MGKIKQGILGGFLGKVGGVVGGNFKGIATMRAMPLSVANPRTAAQVGNRSRFVYVKDFAGGLGLSYIQTWFNRAAVQMSGYNLFCQMNKDAFNAAGVFAPDKVVMSPGSLVAPIITTILYDRSDERLRANISYPISGDHLATDLLTVIAVDGQGNVLGTIDDLPASTTNLDQPFDLSGYIFTELYVYCVSRRADNSKNSLTYYNAATIQA